MRVYEIAKRIGCSSMVVVVWLQRIGRPVKSPSSKVYLLPLELEALVDCLSLK